MRSKDRPDLRSLRRAWVEEIEPRILYSADFSPLEFDASLEHQAAEQRVLDGAGEFALQASDAQSLAYRPSPALSAAPLAFERNLGQAPAAFDFVARGSGYTVALDGGDALIALRGSEAGHALRMNLSGANGQASAYGEDLLAAQSHYLVGAPQDWRGDVDNYAAVRYEEVYAGIDLRYYGNQRQLEYDFVLDPGAQPKDIRLSFEGIAGLAIAPNGELLLTLDAAGNALAFKAPIAYQEGVDGAQPISSRYAILSDGSVGFEVGPYDASRELVIDPILAYGTYLGGTGNDQVFGIAVDSAGCMYVTGYTAADFPTTAGTFSNSDLGGDDVFVAKFAPDLSTLLYSTYVGGSGAEIGYSIAVDTLGAAYVTGYTQSADFPTVSAFQSTLLGGYDAFVFKLSATGNALVYSTFLGGSGSNDNGIGLAVDAAGSAYVTGLASSADFPTTPTAADISYAGDDAFVAKLSPAGNSLVYSTFVGGSGLDIAYSIAVDAGGNAVVVGETDSSLLFPVTANAYQSALGGNSDAFVTLLNATGTGFTYSSYLGGSQNDFGYAVALGPGGKIYLTGETRSNNFDVTGGVPKTTKSGMVDAFVSVIDPALSGNVSLVYSTYLGGSGGESGWGIGVDFSGRIYVTGYTDSNDFPTSGNAYQPNSGAGTDVFVMQIDPKASGAADLLYATYLGGSGADHTQVGVYAQGNFYIGGDTTSASGIATPARYATTPRGGIEGFAAVFSFDSAPVVAPNTAALSYTENAGALLVDAGITVSDTDSALLTGAKIRIIGNYVSGEDVLAFDNINLWGITGIWTAASGTLTLTGSASVANYQAALRSVTYQNTSERPSAATRTVSFEVSDAYSSGAAAKRDITVLPVNDPPVNTVPSAQVTAQNTPLVFSTANGNAIAVADPDAGGGVLQVTLTATNGTVQAGPVTGAATVSGNGTTTLVISGTLVDVNSALQGLAFNPGFNFNGAASLSIATDDQGNSGGGPLADTDAVSITVANDVAPVVTIPGSPLSYNEKAVPITIAPALTVTDTDSPLLDHARVAIGGYVAGEDVLSFTNQLGITASWNATAGELTLSGAATAAAYQTALRTVTYHNTSNAPITASHTITFTVHDGQAQGSAARTITINSINDAPVISVPVAQSVAEDAPLIFSTGTGNAISIADVDAGGASIRLTLTAVNGTLVLQQTGGLTFTAGADGTASMTVTGSSAALNAAVNGLRFTPDANYSGAASLQLTVNDFGNSGGNGPQGDSKTVSISVGAVNDAPSASGVANTSVDEGNSFSAGFTIGDIDTPIGTLAVSATSSNQSIIPDANVVVSGTGANRVISVTPARDAFGGPVTITINVSDGTDITLTTFTVTVNPIQDTVVIVDTTGDAADGDISSIDALRMSRGADGVISLREAIVAANNSANIGGPDRIEFDIAGAGPHTIDLLSALPSITEAVIVDGSTEPDFAGAPLIELNGAAAGAGAHGLHVAGGGSTIRGLVVNRFGGSGILVSGAGGNVIQGNIIGLDVAGNTDLGNGGYGIWLAAGNNLVGGAGAGQRNVVSGNDIDGIHIDGASGNLIQGNFIGTNASGTSPLGNTEDGVWLHDASNNTIGGTAPGEGNVISGNAWSGIALSGASSDNTIQGNAIGLDATAAFALPNLIHGVHILGGSGTLVGGSAAGAGNLIAHNLQDGVAIVVGNGHSVLGNSIHSNGGLGIDIDDDGVTGNDASDSDGEANARMNFPVLYDVVIAGANVTVTGEAREGATLEFFTAAADATRHGEGRTLVGSGVVSGATPGLVDASARRFSFTFAAGALTAGDLLTATATDGVGNSSEFALAVTAGATAKGITVTPTSGLSTTEDGGTATFSVVLDSRPGADVTIALAPSDTTEAVLSTTSLTFTDANWNVAQLVTVTGVPDFLTDGSVPFTVVLASAVSADPGYQGMDAVDVTLTNADGVNDAPVNSVPAAQSMLEDGILLFSSGTGNVIVIADDDAGSNLVRVTLSTSQGGLTLASAAGLLFSAGDGADDASMTFVGTVADINAALDGLRFAPAAGLSGTVSLTIHTDDQGGSGSGGPHSDSATVTIAVMAVNDAPGGAEDSFAAAEDAVLSVAASGVLGNDFDVDLDSLVVSAVEGDSAKVGSAIVLGSGALLTLQADGSLVYDPNGAFDFLAAGETATDGFAYELSDGNGGSDTRTVSIVIAGANDAPLGTDSIVQALEDVGFVFTEADFGFSDPDASDTLRTVTIVTLPEQGELTLDGAAIAAGQVVSQAKLAAGELSFAAAPNASGSAYASFAFRVNDGALDAPLDATLGIDVLAADDAPVAAAGTLSGIEDTAVVFTGAAFESLYSDVELDALVAIKIAELPANGTLAWDGTPVSADQQIAVSELHRLSFTPLADWSGPTNFAWYASDGTAWSEVSAEFTLTLAAANDVPAIDHNSGSVIRGQTVTIGSSVLHAIDPDNTPAQLVYTVAELPSAGSLRLSGAALAVSGTFTQDDVNNGRVTYTHGGDAGSSDAVRFAVSDGAGGSLAGVALNLAVNAPAPPPLIVAPTPPSSASGSEPASEVAAAQAVDASPSEDSGSATGGDGHTTGGDGGAGGGESVAAALAGALIGPDSTALPGRELASQRSASPFGALASSSSVRAVFSAGALNAGPQTGWVSPNTGAPAPIAESAVPAIALNTAAPLQISEALVAFQRTLGNDQWVGELNQMREHVESPIQAQSPMVVSTVAVTGGLSVGYVLWLLRGGLLMSSLLSSLPAWSVVDPLPVLARGGQGNDEADAEDDPLEKLFGRARAALGLARNEPPPHPPETPAALPGAPSPQPENATRSG